MFRPRIADTTFNVPCLYCVHLRSPDGAVQGGAEDLAAVLGEAHTGDAPGVGTLKPTQTQPAVDLPHLRARAHTHTHTHQINTL